MIISCAQNAVPLIHESLKADPPAHDGLTHYVKLRESKKKAVRAEMENARAAILAHSKPSTWDMTRQQQFLAPRCLKNCRRRESSQEQEMRTTG